MVKKFWFVILMLLVLQGAAGCSRDGREPDYNRTGFSLDIESANNGAPATTGLIALGDDNDFYIGYENIAYDNELQTGTATYIVYNPGDAPVSAKLAFPYSSGLYWPSNRKITCDGSDVRFDLSFDWTDSHSGDYKVERFDEGAEYILYTIKVNRDSENASRDAEFYIGADFTLDVSKTRIVADGFGYAANAYGAVRIWSLSDGFDIGLERHLFIIGEDIKLDLKAYEDDGLTRESNRIDIGLERRLINVRDYSLTFSGPLAVYNRNTALYKTMPELTADPTAKDERASVLSCSNERTQQRDAYTQALYRAYAKALDGLLEIHYFIPRGDLYAKAEVRRTNAMLFDIDIPAGDSRTITITFPSDPGE